MIFLVTLKEVDRELADYQAMNVLAEHTNSELVTQRLLSEWSDLANVFLKKDSNKLTPH